ncbi:MAG: hypothetical protein NXI16_17865 [Alphaproteobacteria bacterium]|nr:hypothetical protein [Alphaproteobacteria bacterium]
MAIDPTKPIRPTLPYAGGRNARGRDEGGEAAPRFRPDDPAPDRPAAVTRDNSVEIDGSLFEHLQQIDSDAGNAPATAPYPAEESPWDIPATVRMLALDLDMVLTRLFGVEDGAAHDVAFSVMQGFAREMAFWHARPGHRFLTTGRTGVLVSGTGGVSIALGEKALERGEETVLDRVPLDRCQPGLHHYGDSHYWVRIESVIHEIRARLGHIDFRRMSPERASIGASRGLHSAVMLHADGSRRGIQETEMSRLVIDTVTPLVAKTEPEARAGAIHVDI